jgi:tetratricopeptide (TPR) repeat protein
MDAGWHHSLVRPQKPAKEPRTDNHKVDQRSSLQCSCLLGIGRWVLPFLILAALPLLSAAQSPQVSMAQPSSGDFEVSVGQLKVPGKVWIHLRAAHTALSQRNLKKAGRETDRALQIAPQCAPAFSMKAYIALAASDPLAAIEDATRATFIDRYNADSFVALAMAYNSAEDFPNSQRAAREALAIRPDLWPARLELAKGLYGQGRFEAALAELGALRVDFPDVHLIRGNVFMRLGRAHEGAAEFTLFLQEAPHDRRVEAVRQIVARTEPPGLVPSD